MKISTSIISPAYLAGGALLLVLLVTGTLRYGLLAAPLERDEGEYAYAGQMLLQGIPPYQDVYNMKMPGIYAAYAVCLAMFGQSHIGVHTALLLVNAATIILVFLLAGQCLNRLAAVMAAASFALLSISQSLQGIFANAEHFVLLFATGGMYLLLRGLAGGSLGRIFWAGVLFGLGFLMKQHGAAFGVLAVVYILYAAFNNGTRPGYTLAKQLPAFFSGILIVLGCLGLALYWSGVIDTFWFWTVDYASAYISQVPPALAWHRFYTIFMLITGSAPLLWTLAAAGLGFLLLATTIAPRYRVFLGLLVVFSILSICPGFYFRRHYFVLLLPCASLLAGAGLSGLRDLSARCTTPKIQHGILGLCMLVCLGQPLYIQGDYLFRMDPFQISRSTYQANPFPESLEIARYISQNSAPQDRIAVLGSEPQIFFYAKRRSASGYIYMYPLMENHDFARSMQKQFIEEVEANRPKFIIYVNVRTSWLQRRESHTDIFSWLDRYLSTGQFKLTGLATLYHDRTVYNWGPDIKLPAASSYWVAVFERPG